MTFALGVSTRSPWVTLCTYPPTPCGLATFTQALVAGLSAVGVRTDVVRLVDQADPVMPAGVVHHLVNGAPRSCTATASVLNRYELVLVQHEFGIYGGPDGEDLLTLLAQLRVPVVTVLHTVLTDPTPHQRQVLQGVIAASDVLVTMTRTARERLIGRYGADPQLVHVIPHGAADALVVAAHAAPTAPPQLPEPPRPVILTWGLIGVGKGIEWGIEALTHLRDLDPRPIYHVVGRTHPRVVDREGEQYRHGLQALVRERGLEHDVVFDDRYLDATQLHRMIRSAQVVLLPYDSTEQVTSGVLIEAVAAGRPVVSSSFPHAVELLGAGAGLLVERRNPAQIAAALRRVLAEPGLAGRLSQQAASLAPDLSWRAVAARYQQVGDALVGARGVAAASDRHGRPMEVMA